MDGQGTNFTFYWKIKNFSFFLNRDDLLSSPTFYVDAMEQAYWNLTFYLVLKSNGFTIECYLRRLEDRSNIEYELNYQLSFLPSEESVVESVTRLREVFKSNQRGLRPLIIKQKNEKFFSKKDLLFLDDSLVIRCRIWKSMTLVQQPISCFAETLLETECTTFAGCIAEFSKKENKTIPFNFTSPSSFLSNPRLSIAKDGKLAFEFELKNNSTKRYNIKVFIRAKFYNKAICGQDGVVAIVLPPAYLTHSIKLAFSKEYLSENEYYFTMDNLTFECDITFSTKNTAISANKSEYIIHNVKSKNMLNAKKANFWLKEIDTENLTTLADDLTVHFKEGVSYDTKLKTASETFPAHTVILSARSSVFKSMFTTDMKEKAQNFVDIEDLDADTVRRMLGYIYSDTLDELEYESCKSLYFAADKYDIVSLKHRCYSFLKQNLSHSNYCDVLLLADAHQDEYLKNAVQDYIAENDEEILFSADWRNFGENHAQLTIDTLLGVYRKTLRL